MKTKIASFLSIVALSLLTLTTGAFADLEEGFYEKNHVRGFISIGADYRGMRSEFQRYVNNMAFKNWGYQHDGRYFNQKDSNWVDTTFYYSGALPGYSKFDDYYLGLHVNIGAQYKQFLTWFDINFMPMQTSKRPRDSYFSYVHFNDSTATPQRYAEDLYDVEWFTYGADWMFGWKLFGEHTFINLIPSVGFGFNIINFHYASDFILVERGKPEHTEIVRDRFYSTMATTVTSELEFRIELGRLGLGAYGGYRFVRYNDPDIEGFTNFKGKNETDNVGDTWYLGARVTWYFLSPWEKKQADKL